MGDPLGGFKPRRTLSECFWNFPKFRDELEFLVNEGYMKVTGPETCVWLKSKTSLAKYFRWTSWDNGLLFISNLNIVHIIFIECR